MNSRERVLSAVARQGFDRIPVKHEGTPEVNKMIMDHFGRTDFEKHLAPKYGKYLERVKATLTRE